MYFPTFLFCAVSLEDLILIYAEWINVSEGQELDVRHQSAPVRRCSSSAGPWWNKRWLLTPPISWLPSASPQVPSPRLRYLQTVISNKYLSEVRPLMARGTDFRRFRWCPFPHRAHSEFLGKCLLADSRRRSLPPRPHLPSRLQHQLIPSLTAHHP